MKETSNRIPVTIIAGFLGAGKTTLLNNLLTAPHGKEVAVLVNEFGEIGIDHALIVASDDDVIELSNGCICCSIRGDLVVAIDKLLSRNKNFDYLLIETTGLADPAPVAQTFLADERMLSLFQLDSVVTVIDAHHVLDLLTGKLTPELAELGVKQIAFADKLILNKVSMVPKQTIVDITTRIRGINQIASIIPTDHCLVEMNEIFDLHAFDLEQTLKFDPEFLDHEFHDHLDHTQSMGIQVEGLFNIDALNIWLRWLLTDPDMTIYRMKGVICVGPEPERYVFQCVQQLFSSDSEGMWPASVPKKSSLTIIGRELKKELIRERFMYSSLTS
jgi:G3E family GTPase